MKYLSLVLLSLLITCHVNAKVSQPSIKLASLTELQIQQLAKLGRVWGFVKYFHPNVAKGQHNLDKEIIRIMPDLLEAESTTQANLMLSQWIKSLGEMPECKPNCIVRKSDSFNTFEFDKKYTDTNFQQFPDVKFKSKSSEYTLIEKPEDHLSIDFSWLTDQNYLGEQLSKQLTYILHNRTEQAHYYYGYEGTGNVKVLHEDDYPDKAAHDSGIQLIALFRFWNLVEYFSPYKYLTDKNWQQVLTEYIPIFASAKNHVEYHDALLRLFAETDDAHTGFLKYNKEAIDELFEPYELPIRVKKVENEWVIADIITGYDDVLKIGSVVESIDGRNLLEYEKFHQKWAAGGNDAIINSIIARRIVRTGKSRPIVSLKSGEQASEPAVAYGETQRHFYNKAQTAEPYKLLTDDIGYLNLGLLTPEQVEPAMETFADLPVIIIDVRAYPKGTAWTLVNYLLPEPTGFVRFVSPDKKTPGDFVMSPVYKLGIVNPDYYKGRVILLANENSQSQSEYTLMMLRKSPKAIVVGSQTAGADGNVSYIKLPGGVKTAISGLGILTPEKRQTQRVGIIPDMEVKPTIESIKQGRDLVLEKAIELANSPQAFEALLPSKVQL